MLTIIRCRWTCDFCGTSEETASEQLPMFWFILYVARKGEAGNISRHACRKCASLRSASARRRIEREEEVSRG